MNILTTKHSTLQEVFEVKYARMPEEPPQTDATPPSSVASGLTRGDDGSGMSSSGESSDNDSEEERERRLKDLQEQVYIAFSYSGCA